jgi:hypothetical protein
VVTSKCFELISLQYEKSEIKYELNEIEEANIIEFKVRDLVPPDFETYVMVEVK